MDFINYSHPSQLHSTRLKRQAHSFAARATHARARKAQPIRHHPTSSAVEIEKPQGSYLYKTHVSSQLALRKSPDYCPSPLSPLGASRRDPFHAATKLFSSHDDFLLDQYITVVVPHMRLHCHVFLSQDDKHVKSAWVQLALGDPSLLAGLFLLTSRFLNLAFQRKEYLQQAILYKLVCLDTVSKAISAQIAPSDAVLSIALLLATDEIMVHDVAMAAQHVTGALKMVKLRGGPEALGTNSFVATMLEKYVFEKGILGLNPAPPCGSRFMQPESSVPELDT